MEFPIYYVTIGQNMNREPIKHHVRSIKVSDDYFVFIITEFISRTFTSLYIDDLNNLQLLIINFV